MYFLLSDSLLRGKYNFWMILILKSVYLKLLFKRENEVFFFLLSQQSLVSQGYNNLGSQSCTETQICIFVVMITEFFNQGSDFFSNIAYFETSLSAIITDSGIPKMLSPVLSMRMLISER